MNIGGNDILAFLFGVILIIIIGRVFLAPIKFILKILLNSALGLTILFLINFFGAGAGISVGLNWLTGLICGVLGIPGIVLVLLLKWLGFG
ncbi:MAG: pro-sigmaK processing inhibitor BofA family protein [Clostridia bacterium]|nr:pro-sigmaK processing inhibitor BofA family protein [Clostridia bacterium]MBR2742207.1 pro-sigmaK processing inhibitor BofA family protein [Clostridia bacterium]